MEEYKRYFELLGTTSIDNINPGLRNNDGMPWTEFDTVLLEVEEMYNTYEYRDSSINRHILFLVKGYLNDYLTGGATYGTRLDEDAQDELEAFVAEHKDSIYWSIVNYAVKKYQQNNWTQTGFRVNRELDILFEEKFAAVNYEDIKEVNRWPIHESTDDFYQEFQKGHEATLLKGLSAFEAMSLYLFAVEEGDVDTYYSLYDRESKGQRKGTVAKENQNVIKANYWKDIVKATNYIVGDKQADDNLVNFSFITEGTLGEIEIVGTIQMEKEAGIWKVSDISMEN